MDTASAPIDNQPGVDNTQQAPNVNQPAPSADVTPLNPVTGDVANSLKGYDIKGADLSELGIDPLSGKYKTVKDLESAYTHLQKKFGSFAGAPDEYTLSEGLEAGDWLQEWGRENGLNQEGFEGLVTKYQEVQAEQTSAKMAEEYAKLGNNADARIDNLRDWGNANNIPVEVMDGMFQSAEHVQALEALMKGSGVQAPANVDAGQPPVTSDYLNEITYAKDDYGRLKTESNPEYAQWVQQQWAKKR